ncbi:branched-chain amino acid ABC transporter permease [Massilia pseudoviolaceinigra]|uniref:branched-chain amino acid ABC transporter permease n=1 Tax=Massilia pseudoviolaceinigra TaxID=3057165 RepID=UPI0027969E8D|nr:branched-chain amino acid ABC transporter permease [Massilia sp. CCM 9206]MDQ1921967.1 branched-chain amino acid ABC transporter permease [Massilia sp. CCM 9206]
MRLTYTPLNLGRYLVWGGFALILVLAPLIFTKGAALSILSQIGTVMIFGLSYNMLLGQGGMLSFGHAVYSGLGAFFAIHAMNSTGIGALVPTSLIPLVGGVAGMGFGVLFGYVTTKKSGTTFAMITLGLVELVFASSLMFPGFFGGEGGITTNRVRGEAFLGITYGPQVQVYYLIAAWLFVTTVAMFAFTQTPLGRMANAVRDNPERVEFIGYDTQWVRYLTLILSAFFAGISGGLSAINFEIVSAENVSAIRSGSILLFVFIGGIGFFFGPLLGTIVGIFFSVMLSDFTPAWQLYLGLFFILLVRYAPAGLASLILMLLRVASARKFARIWKPLLAVGACVLVALAGMVMGTEMLYHLTLDAANGSVMTRFGQEIDTKSAGPWLVAGALLVAGIVGYRRFQPGYYAVWSDVNAEIVAQQRGGVA